MSGISWPAQPVPSLLLPPRGAAVKWLTPPSNVGTNATLPKSTLFLAPLVIASVTQMRYAAVQFTAAGDATSLFGAKLYADNGNFYPGEILAITSTVSTGTSNSGSIPTNGVPGTYIIPSTRTLNPGVYWFGGFLTWTTTAPTMACGTWGPYAFPTPLPPADLTVTMSGLQAPNSSAAMFPLGATPVYGASIPSLALGLV